MRLGVFASRNAGEKLMYRVLREHSAWAGIRRLTRVEGATVDPVALANFAVHYNNTLQLWNPVEAGLPSYMLISADGREVLGTNEAFSLAPSDSSVFFSCLHVWRIAMVQYRGKESYAKFQDWEDEIGITCLVQHLRTATYEIATTTGCKLRSFRPLLVTDWMALLAVVRNVSQPSSTGANHSICLWCAFSGADKCNPWARGPWYRWEVMSP